MSTTCIDVKENTKTVACLTLYKHEPKYLLFSAKVKVSFCEDFNASENSNSCSNRPVL